MCHYSSKNCYENPPFCLLVGFWWEISEISCQEFLMAARKWRGKVFWTLKVLCAEILCSLHCLATCLEDFWDSLSMENLSFSFHNYQLSTLPFLATNSLARSEHTHKRRTGRSKCRKGEVNAKTCNFQITCNTLFLLLYNLPFLSNKKEFSFLLHAPLFRNVRFRNYILIFLIS